jgi:NTP pyrophosphatase (non-canonical NTP hydrolase)
VEFIEYQKLARQTAVYRESISDEDERLSYVTLGLIGEAGEFANKIKKIFRDGDFSQTALCNELGDILWYVAMAAEELGTTLENIAWDNLEKLAERKRRGTLKGNGDNR